MQILIIDDDEVKRRNIRSYLEDKHTVDEATNAVEGIEALSTVKYDVVFLDKLFPIRQGDRIEENYSIVLREIHRRKIPVKVIMCSSSKNKLVKDNYGLVSDYIVYDSSVYLKPYIDEALGGLDNEK